MADVATLGIKVDGVGNITKASSALNKFSAEADKADDKASLLSSSVGALGSAAKLLGGVLVGGAIVGLVRSFSASSSAATDLAARLQLTAGSAEQAESANRRLQEIAIESGADITTLTGTFIRLNNAFLEIGYSSRDTTDFIQSLNYALTLSGATGQRAEIIQTNLSRAMASGVLRGNELNAILENGGKVARLLAKELGTTTGGLRQLGAEGKITADVIHSALVSNMEEMASQIGDMPITMDFAMKRISTAFELASDRFDQAWGRGSSLPDAVNGIADALLEWVPLFEQIGYLVQVLTTMLIDGFSDSADEAEELSGELDKVERDFDQLGLEVARVFDAIIVAAKFTGTILIDVVGAPVKQLISLFELLGNTASSALSLNMGGIAAATNKFLKDTQRITDELGNVLSGDVLNNLVDEQLLSGVEARLNSIKKITIDELNATRDEQKRADFAALNEGDKAVAKSAKQRELSGTGYIRSLRERIALIGKETEAETLLAKMRVGTMEFASQQEAQMALAMAKSYDETMKEVEATEALEKARERVVDMLLSMGTYEEQALDRMRKNVDLLGEAKLNADEYANALARLNRSSIQDMPAFQGLHPLFGGPSGEMLKIAEQEAELNDWYTKQLELQREFLDAKLINENEYADAVREITERNTERLGQLQQAYTISTISSMATMTGNVASLLEGMGAKGSAAYKVMFAISKAASIAQAIMNTEEAATKALAIDPTGPMPAITRATGYLSVAAIAAQSITGMAHDGIDRVPEDGTWLLQKGERVVSSQTSDKLDGVLNNLIQDRRSSNSDGNNINIVINSNGSSSADNDEEGMFAALAKDISKLVDERIKQNEQASYRQGGAAWQFQQGMIGG